MPDTIAVKPDTSEKASSSWDEDLTKTTKERWAWYMALEERAKERDSASSGNRGVGDADLLGGLNR
jgi:hypothetical protein